ncbi:uncharacterized transmembrane protein DDB_G0289901 [Anopheles cruzii]|uniref:uncharacterized transmembrane protein DDB_G0289901 n=1 Tax=Anopheles cruzii TaxID=68878 RepID=UPI0022EC4662|nr:uncharacterized transmembrane protein DDB_G0289901 [Anopheles cruzii]
MREVDTSETSVVWPAWCYSGETTVNEDLPQRLVAAAAAVAAATTTVAPSTQKERRRRRRRRQQQPQQPQRASSNQSRRRSSSSASVSSPSPPPLPPPSSVFVGRGKRKSITRTTPLGSPVGGSAITAALEAAGSEVELGGSTTTTTSHYDGRSSPATTALQLLTGCRGDRSRRSSDSEEKEAPGRTGAEVREVNECYRFGAIDSRVLRQHRAALHSLDKMLSERIYDRKKYLNSPTGGGVGGGGVSGTAGSPTGTHGGGTGFYEKYRHLNGSSGDTGGSGSGSVIELSLIKNGTVAAGGGGGSSINGVGGSSAHLSAIAASIISGSNGSSSGNGGIPGDATPAAAVNSNGGAAGGGSSGIGSLGNTNQITSNKSSGNNNNNNSSANNNNNIGSGQCINQHSNSSSIKSERFSPPNTDAQSMASRSRSATPSSFSGTPPQTMHPAGGGDGFPVASGGGGLLPSPNSLGTVGRPEFQARNYSDFMRSLAAKYNNNNNNSNDVSQNMKNSFLEPKMRFTQPKSFIEGSLSGGGGGKKSSPLTSTQVPNPSIMTSLFSGLPFQSAVFPPLIDMSSTQALVTLARAAKESDIHHILKTDTGGGLNRKPLSLSRSSSPSAGTTHHHHFPSPFAATGYLPGLLPSHQHHHGLSTGFPSQAVVPSAGASLKSPSRAPEPTLATTFPLDLSASTPTPSKRIKLSPTASSGRHREASPAPSSTNSQPSDSLLDLKPTSRKCHARIEEIGAWTVDHVCDFVASIDICAEYVQNFRDQSIDGAGLPLLTEEHLTNSLGMKLGPALKLRSMLAKKLGGPCPCTLCAAVPTPPTRTNSSGSGSSKGDTTPTNRPPSNGSIG